VLSDFELAIINAAEAKLPQSDPKLCLFHLGQSVWRRVANAGLQTAYNDPDDRSIRKGVQQLVSLAFVPVEDVVECY